MTRISITTLEGGELQRIGIAIVKQRISKDVRTKLN